MPTAQEKAEFSARLKFAIRKSSVPVKGATDLARLFNVRYRADSGVSVQTTHKWMTGGAIPTLDKIKTLAEWLNVTEHWLHYGPPPSEATEAKTKRTNAPPSAATLALASEIEALPDHQRYLVKALIDEFLH